MTGDSARVPSLKIGLLTYHFSDNYGALFQAYGLREWLRKQGHAAEFVNYHPRYVEEGGPFDRIYDPRLWKKNLTIGYMKSVHHWSRWFGDRTQQGEFDSFRLRFLGVAGPRRYTVEELADDVSELDMLICGSDQIWNPSVQRGLDPVYFLHFSAAESLCRISYAPSFGKNRLDVAHERDAKRFLESLDGISVRERSGMEIVFGLTGREAIVVPDPTVLLGQFSGLLGKSAQDAAGDHVFCYALRSDVPIRNVSERVGEALDSTIISPRTARQRWSAIGTGVRPGPVGWLRSLASARFVVSNSFHGIVLSILHHRPFIAVGLPAAKSALNERALDLLEQVGLRDRFVDTYSSPRVDALLAEAIDWDRVDSRVARMREVGEGYLRDQISRCVRRSKSAEV